MYITCEAIAYLYIEHTYELYLYNKHLFYSKSIEYKTVTLYEVLTFFEIIKVGYVSSKVHYMACVRIKKNNNNDKKILFNHLTRNILN